MNLMPEPLPEVYISSKIPFRFRKIYLLLGLIFPLLAVVLFLLFTPLNLYLDIHQFFAPQALSIDDKAISWDQLKGELVMANANNNLKNRQQKLNFAIDKAIGRQILKQTVATEAATTYPNLFFEEQTLKSKVEQDLVNWRTGGYFIARFSLPQATQSAEVLKKQARGEMENLSKKLSSGQAFTKLLEEAGQNKTLEYLNGGAFLPGMYLEKITPDKFPLKIKSFREKFFSMEVGVSEIITLSWDDYEGISYGQEFKGEFAYAVIRMDQVNPGYLDNYNSWLASQKEKIKVGSYVYIPIFFNWF